MHRFRKQLGRKPFGWIAIGLVMALAATVSVPAQAAEKTLRVRYGGDISGMDPATIFQIENQTIALNVYNGLVRYDEKRTRSRPISRPSGTSQMVAKPIRLNCDKGLNFIRDSAIFRLRT